MTTWQPRPYQAQARDALRNGIRRALLVWHRRAGKDNFALNHASDEAEKTVGTYWHMFPFHTQARKAIWYGIDNDGQRFIDQAFPPETREATRNQDMQIELTSGSIWQMCGSDAYDRLVGSNVRGAVFSEWALCDPRAWDFIRPIIRENGGWALFITTYRGRNHAFRMARRMAKNPNWYVDIRTVDDTTRHDGTPVITPADIQAERDEGMSEALIQQEYYCNPIAAAEGAIYGKSTEKLLDAGRAGVYAYDASRPVFASWSLQWDDQYTVVFVQHAGNETRVIGSKSFPFLDLSDCLDQVNTSYPWRRCARHIVPANTSGDAVDLIERGGNDVDLAPESDDVVKITRNRLALTWIDSAIRPWTAEEENNALLIDALNGYRFSEAKAEGVFTSSAANTWEKHFARAFEVYAAWRQDESEHDGGWHPKASSEARDRAVI